MRLGALDTRGLSQVADANPGSEPHHGAVPRPHQHETLNRFTQDPSATLSTAAGNAEEPQKHDHGSWCHVNS